MKSMDCIGKKQFKVDLEKIVIVKEREGEEDFLTCKLC